MMKVVACVTAAAFVFSATGSAAPHDRTFWARTFRFVDTSRTIRMPNGGRVPRPLVTIVRAPATGGGYPLIVFGHGFALTPATYARLLNAWSQAGFVVAAPIFPLGNANAPGGPNESDLVNQPRDMSFVITKLLALSAGPNGALAGKINPTRVAVAGHSDGAETALGVAYDRRFRDARVRAAIVMSGAAFPGMASFPARGPPLLAVQGTADPINAPANTTAYFRRARRPKFLLWLIGVSHRPPYTTQEPQLGIVEHTTVAFLDHYFRGKPLRALIEAARIRRLTRLLELP
jgi:pimeloyl-ACP methyl ester carboxylesterase